MVTLRVLPEDLSRGTSPWPWWKLRAREPPPPKPSFFTMNVKLGGGEQVRGHRS